MDIKQAVIEQILGETREFLEKEFNSGKLLFTTKITVTGKTFRTELKKMAPLLEPEMASSKLLQVTKQGHWDIVTAETFTSIRDKKIRAMGVSILTSMNSNKHKEISAAEIIKIFNKHKIPIAKGVSFGGDLSRISNRLRVDYGCTILRLHPGEFNTDPNRKFALFYTGKSITPKT